MKTYRINGSPDRTASFAENCASRPQCSRLPAIIWRDFAEKIYERHTLFSTWLTNLGVDPQIAQEDACRIEHVISEQSFAALKKHVTENNEI